MPVYGNLVTFELKEKRLVVSPGILKRPYVDEPMMQLLGLGDRFYVIREKDENKFSFWKSETPFKKAQIPFKTKYGITNFEFLKDTLNKLNDDILFSLAISFDGFKKVYSQPTDSLLKPMMHRSDNFFAEQTLLMVSNERLGIMNDEKIIDTLLKTDFKDLPQKPRWVDGSGLSRYNLFSPQDFVTILNKMKTEFGMDRLKNILATGNTGTLTNYYKAENGYIFAKTGTLSGVVAFSGFLYTQKNKLLIFSVLVNNCNGAASDVRRAVEKFIEGIREKY
jgi:D-alanyl-D-alanine carboxypeptidase/D-alanyl-D-alanine-endopeptidase (penicillin-binding protein 4)